MRNTSVILLACLPIVLAACGQSRPAPIVRSAPPAAVATSAPVTSALPSAPAASPGRSPRPTTVSEIARSASDLPAPLTRTEPATVTVELEAREVIAKLDEGQTYAYWTFNGTVPGPMIRVRVGDTVELHLSNKAGDLMPHSIDLHAVTGPGGGATASQTNPGQMTSFSFRALNPGLYVYHCATAPIPMHIANGMYGMILVEPAGGLPKVDREFYVMQGEIYSEQAFGAAGHHDFSNDHMLGEKADYVLFNGRVGSLVGASAMRANVGETIRLYFGVGGFLPSSLHLIGEIFDRVYPEAAVGAAPLQNVQTTFVPAGGATMVEVQFQVPGSYTLVDHSLVRALNKGAAAVIAVDGPEAPSIYSGPTSGAGH